MMKVWKSNLKNHLKVGFFRATVESVLLYGAECWTMTGKMRNRLDGTYTRMLRAVLGVSWKEHKTNKELYGNLPKITDTLMIRKLRFIGHCWRRKDEVISELLLWEPKHGARKRAIHSSKFGCVNHHPWELHILHAKTLTSWAQRDKTHCRRPSHHIHGY